MATSEPDGGAGCVGCLFWLLMAIILVGCIIRAWSWAFYGI